MCWQRANATQHALAEAEQHFLDVCDTSEEVDEDAIDEAYDAMQCAAVEADEAIDEIRKSTLDWSSVVARMLR